MQSAGRVTGVTSGCDEYYSNQLFPLSGSVHHVTVSSIPDAKEAISGFCPAVQNSRQCAGYRLRLFLAAQSVGSASSIWMSNVNTHSADLLILGAGAAGLSAATALASKGISSLLLEARDRLGGRIFTVDDPNLGVPIEMGAEFIHGLPPEIWQILQARNVVPIETEGDDWCFRKGKLSECDFFSDVDDLLSRLHADGHDESFADFLEREGKRFSRQTRDWALGYVTGFHAGDPKRISVHSLIKSTEADEEIEGHRAFRIPEGYGWLVEHFRQQLERWKISFELNTVVKRLEWNRNRVILTCVQNGRTNTFQARRALVTLPLGVLQAGSIEFRPELPAVKRNAMELLAMGKVVRVTLHFRERFWDRLYPDPNHKSQAASDMSFLFSQMAWFPTWWTTMPRKYPILTAWAPFHDAARLAGQRQEVVVSHALDSLAALLNQPRAELQNLLERAYYHDWEADPFSRGAYSYVCVGGDHAEEELSRPLNDTLFFAGEATDVTGHNGTVHGAIASGYRAARELALSIQK